MEVVLIAHDIRSAHNVGSLARSADGFGVKKIYCSGYTPYLKSTSDERLPHIRKKTAADIHKTALGAEETVELLHSANLELLVKNLKNEGFTIAALEQSKNSTPLGLYKKSEKLAVLLGTETTGLPAEILQMCDVVLEIPMLGQKESLNVSVAGAIALYELKRSELY